MRHVAPSFTKRNKIYIHHHCIRIIYKENFFIEFRYNPPPGKKLHRQAKSIQHVLSSFFILSPLLLETSRFSHLTRTLFDSITVRNHHPRFLHADDRKTGCGEMLVLVVENSLSSGLCAREQA